MPNVQCELLTAYNTSLAPIGDFPRDEIHARGLLHRTVRIWAVRDGRLLFQRRSPSKALFPSRFDPLATGHVDPGEDVRAAALRELAEETGICAAPDGPEFIGELRLPFRRPDGALDNELASIFLYRLPDGAVPAARDETAGFASATPEDYDAMVRTGKPAAMADLLGGPEIAAGPDRFCLPDLREWELVLSALRRFH